MSSVSQRTATASIWTISGKFLARLLDFVSLLILARLLSPADFGLVAIATSVLVIVETILDLPLTQALMRQSSAIGVREGTRENVPVRRLGASSERLVGSCVPWNSPVPY